MAGELGDLINLVKWMNSSAKSAMSQAGQKMASTTTAAGAPTPNTATNNQKTGPAADNKTGLGGATSGLLGAIFKEVRDLASRATGAAQGAVGKAEGKAVEKAGEKGRSILRDILSDPESAKEKLGSAKQLAGKAAPWLAAASAAFGGSIPGLGMLSKGAGMLSNPFGTIAGMIMGPHPGQGLAGGLGAAGSIASMFGMTQAGRLLGSASRLVGIGGRLYGGTGQIAGGFGQALGGGETTAEQGLGGAFKGMQGLGTMLGPTPAGLALKVIGKFGETVVGSIEKLRTWNRELQQANFKFADFSASMAQVQAQQEVRRIQFEQERGESRATMAGFQSEQSMNLDKSLAGIEDVLADIKNFLSGTASMFMRDGIEIWKTLSGFIVVEWMKKQAEEKAGMGVDADKMLEEASKQRWNEIYGRPDRFGGPGGGNRGM